MANITLPFEFEPRWYQLEILESPKRFKVLVLPRRAGKSKTALNEQIMQSQTEKGIYYYFLPTYRQAKQVIWDSLAKEHIPPEIVDKVNESELAVYYKNGSIQRFVGCEDPDAHRGINPVGVVLDEYSEMKPKIWTDIIQPVLRENKGRCTFVFTPKGKNHAWALFQKAKANKEWFTSLKSIDDTKHLEEKEWEEALANSPQATIQQEYYCEFLDQAGAFFRRVKDNIYSDKISYDSSHKYQIGVDLAKYQDWTVITIFDLFNFKILPQERFNQIDWNLQKSRIEATVNRYRSDNHKPRVVVDATGVGDPIVEDLTRLGLNVLPFKFTQSSRKELLTNLAVMLEQDKIKIPNDTGLIDELESMRYEISQDDLDKKMKAKLKVPDGLPDDRIMSLALAVWDIHGQPKEKTWEYNKFTIKNKPKFDKNRMFKPI